MAPRSFPAVEAQREEAGPAQEPGELPGAHDPVVVVSSSPDSSPAPAIEEESTRHSGGEAEEAGIPISSGPENDAGEGLLAGPAPTPQQGPEERRPSLEEEIAEMRRTLRRHTYRLSFIQKTMVRLRWVVQCSRGRERQQRQRRREN
ncbi:UNVERIFIED_CONTAM: hypothetical protein K2H54_038788 [Gekko kuhli]